MTTTTRLTNPKRAQGMIATLNTRRHKLAVYGFLFIVLFHWVEHFTQAFQIYVQDWARPKAGGLLGLFLPWLVSSEWLHYGYAIVMLVGFIALRHGFTGRSRTWWSVALWIQAWHHIEHLLLLLQATSGANLLGQAKPTSIAQLVFPRVELHLFYNAIVFVPMVVAMVLHRRPRPAERNLMRCTCAVAVTPAPAR